jgi:hypothetical protein
VSDFAIPASPVVLHVDTTLAGVVSDFAIPASPILLYVDTRLAGVVSDSVIPASPTLLYVDTRLAGVVSDFVIVPARLSSTWTSLSSYIVYRHNIDVILNMLSIGC